MNTAAEVLLIVISSLIALGLILGILLLIKALLLVRRLRRVAQQAEKVTEAAKLAADLIHKKASPVTLWRLVSRIKNEVSLNNKEKKKHG